MNGRLTDDAARILAAFQHANLETVDCDAAERLERDRQWVAVLERVERLGALNRNARIFPHDVERAIAERWTLAPLTTSAHASSSAATSSSQLAPAAPPPFHALLLQASESGEISVSIETEHGWCEVISACLAGEVWQTAESHWIAELVQRQHELAAQTPAAAAPS